MVSTDGYDYKHYCSFWQHPFVLPKENILLDTLSGVSTWDVHVYNIPLSESVYLVCINLTLWFLISMTNCGPCFNWLIELFQLEPTVLIVGDGFDGEMLDVIAGIRNQSPEKWALTVLCIKHNYDNYNYCHNAFTLKCIIFLYNGILLIDEKDEPSLTYQFMVLDLASSSIWYLIRRLDMDPHTSY